MCYHRCYCSVFYFCQIVKWKILIVILENGETPSWWGNLACRVKMLNSEFLLADYSSKYFSSLARVSSLIAWVICILRPLLIVIALSGKTQIDGCYPRETQEWRSKWGCSPELEALARPGVMVSLQINGNTSKGAHFYVLLLHLVIFCFFRHVPGLPAPSRLKRPISSTRGIEKLLFGQQRVLHLINTSVLSWYEDPGRELVCLRWLWMVSAESLGASTLQRGKQEGAELLGSSWSHAQSSFLGDNKPLWTKEVVHKEMWEITGLAGRKPWQGGKAALIWCVLSMVSHREAWHRVGLEPQLNLSCSRLWMGSWQTNLWHQLQGAI